ncbi:NUDIX domain-containing protein [Dickeya fangzhongdai]|uniref:Hydrolase n=2 Tax=Pectobacteriaceae TaxID=1903410 RepID=A0A2K8QQL8_9GAMM|nr:hydrolase [Dickeya fangzhongdai]QOH49247.1 NUDIX domain-containing protein [Dickeya fangzhongdai]QOH53550.1 NUDIX domain-containing protein [Dickeya fangzhongdai]
MKSTTPAIRCVLPPNIIRNMTNGIFSRRSISCCIHPARRETMIRCACLVHYLNNQLLVVKPRNKNVWYLPGGKINDGENIRTALIRELQEELNIQLREEDMTYLRSVIGPSHDYSDDTLLHCFTTSASLNIRPDNEIEQVKYITSGDVEVAPLVTAFIR